MSLLPITYPVTCHTDHVGPGSTFVAIKGFKDDGTRYIQKALELGASTIISEPLEPGIDTVIKGLCKKYNAQYIHAPNARQALAQESAKRLGSPAQKLKIIGITGTKGKSTTTYLLEHILKQAGYKTALISTIANKIGDQTEESERTTPESDYLQMFFAECVKKNITHVVMEVSSHAVSLDRVYGIDFDAIGFTNLAPDHLDFYDSLENYFAAKIKLFSQIKANGVIVINSDEAWGQKAVGPARAAAEKNGAQVLTFGIENNASVPLVIHQASCDGIELALALQPTLIVECPQLFGTFNCYNIAMASIIAVHLEVNYTALMRALKNFKGVPGRLQRHVLKNGALAFVDYAHNAQSFQAILSTLRPYTNHLIVVFGCGGDRDKARRASSGHAAAQFADVIILTDDNPRTEDRMAIINDILAGIPEDRKNSVIIEPDRREAIKAAASIVRKDSIIALLGKGHENYYIIGDQTLHFDDFEEISKY